MKKCYLSSLVLIFQLASATQEHVVLPSIEQPVSHERITQLSARIEQRLTEIGQRLALIRQLINQDLERHNPLIKKYLETTQSLIHLNNAELEQNKKLLESSPREPKELAR